MAIKGRQTLRKGQLLTDPGTVNAPLWEFEPKPGSALAKLEASYLGALDAVDQLDAKRAEIARGNLYTETGARTAAFDFAAQKLAPKLKGGRRAVEDAKRAAAEMRAKLKPKAPDRSDIVGFLQRSEIRSWFYAKPKAERDNWLSRNIDRLDPDVSLALIELPGEIVGIADDHRGLLAERAMRAEHGDAIDEVTALEKGIEIAERTLNLSTEAIARDCGADTATLESKAAPYTPAPVWLRKQVENGTEKVVVVDLETKTQRPATPEEIADGRFYASFDDYQKDRAA